MIVCFRKNSKTVVNDFKFTMENSMYNQILVWIFFLKVILKVYVKILKFNSENYNLIVRDDV